MEAWADIPDRALRALTRQIVQDRTVRAVIALAMHNEIRSMAWISDQPFAFLIRLIRAKLRAQSAEIADDVAGTAGGIDAEDDDIDGGDGHDNVKGGHGKDQIHGDGGG